MKKIILFFSIIFLIGIVLAFGSGVGDIPSKPDITSEFTPEEKAILTAKFGTDEYVITDDYITDTEYCFSFSPVNKKKCVYNYRKEMEVWTSHFDKLSNQTITENLYNLTFAELREREIIKILKVHTKTINITAMNSSGYTQSWGVSP